MFVVYLYYHFFVLGKSLDINVLNFIFLTLIIFLYGTPAAMLKAVKASTSAAWGVILQFPFYAVPFMAVCGLEFKDFVGYTFVAFIVLGIIMVLGLTFIPFAI